MRRITLGLALPRAAAPQAHAASVGASPLTLETGALAPGQFELLTRSTLPSMVSGGQVLAEVRGISDGTVPIVRAGRRDVTGAFAPAEDGISLGLVRGLRRGPTVLRARVGRRV